MKAKALPLRHESRKFLIGGLWLAALVCFIGLALRANTAKALALDVSLAQAIQGLPEALDRLFGFENWLGDGMPLAMITLLSAALLYRRAGLVEARLLLLTFLIRACDVLVKRVVDEPRPSASLIEVNYDNLSFPSGHVIGVTLVFALVAVFAPRLFASRWLVLAVQALSLFLVATIGLARVWVGAHWPTDVVGGYLYALLFLIPALAWWRGRSGAAPVSGLRLT